MSKLVAQIDALLSLPARLEDGKPVFDAVGDTSVLTCGCLLSESLASQLAGEQSQLQCPVCGDTVSILAPVVPMRELYNLRNRLLDSEDALSEVSGETKKDKSRRRSSSKRSTNTQLSGSLSRPQLAKPKQKPGSSKVSLLAAFHEVFTEVNNTTGRKKSENSVSVEGNNIEDWMSTMKSYRPDRKDSAEIDPLVVPMDGADSIATTEPITIPRKPRTSFSGMSSNLTKALHSSSSSPVDVLKKETNKELLYAKNFPFYRKLYTYHTHQSKFFLKSHSSKLFINTGIAPNLRRFVLLDEKRWEVYSMDPDRPEEQPVLESCGKYTGSYGTSFDTLSPRPTLEEIYANSNSDPSNRKDFTECLNNWEHLCCKISNNLLVVAGTRGILRIFDLNNQGKPLYTYYSKFPIRCIDISENEECISLGVTGKDKFSGFEQPFIVLLTLKFAREEDDPFAEGSPSGIRVTPLTVTLPYRDPINILQFSPNSQYLSCATAMESRFMVISIVEPTRPSLIMKSQRKLDTSLESEGITDIQFFPDNRLMTLTSVAFNSCPIVIDTKITSITGLEGVAQPVMLVRLDEVGSTIHKAAVSPRGDSVAYLDRGGACYLMTSPRMDDNDNKRIVVVTEAANSYRVRESATMRFDRDGYKLYILDRKGLLQIADFTAGTREDHSISRTKILN